MSNVRILQGTVFDTLPTVEPGSIDCAVTSPPYWKLRSYLPKDHPLKALELGQEPTPAEYVANVVRWCGLVRNALADHGTLWLNVGDSYAGTGKSGGGKQGERWTEAGAQVTGARGGKWHPAPDGIPEGNLCLIPQRLMIALQDDGWLVRSVVVWHKPAPMPCSVTGWMWKKCRVKTKPQATRTDNKKAAAHSPRTATFKERHEKGIGVAEWTDCPGCKKCEPNGGYILRRGSWRPTSAWEPVIMLAKTANYYSDGEPTKTPPKDSTVARDAYTRVADDPDEQFAVAHDHETVCDGGANLRDVWTIGFEPLAEKHYAAYPSELVYRCLASGTSQEGYCDRCSAPFVRVVETKPKPHPSPRSADAARARSEGAGQSGAGNQNTTSVPLAPETRTVGWRPSCRCPDAKPRPGRVLDPFSGSGRTAIVARRLGLDFVGCELNPEYVAMSKRLIAGDAPLFNDLEGAA